MMTRTVRARRQRTAFLPALDRLEGRVVLSSATIAGAIRSPAIVEKAASFFSIKFPPIRPIKFPPIRPPSVNASLNQRVAAYLAQNVGKRLGGGECAHLASESLRVAGAKFGNVGPDSPGSGDYVWGTLVKTVEFKVGTAVDSRPSSALQPGDVLQYRNTTFSTGSKATHHTSVVAAVDSSGRVTKVYEQNLGNGGVKGVNRTVTLRPLDLSKLTGGFVRAYRPIARTAQTGHYEFTITNNAATSQTLDLLGKSFTLTSSNTTNSYATYTASGSRPSLTLNGKSFALDDGAGYQIVGSGKSITLQKLSA